MDDQSSVQPSEDSPQEPTPPQPALPRPTLPPRRTLPPQPTLPTQLPPYLESSDPYYWAPTAAPQPAFQQYSPAGTVIGSGLSVIGALAAVIAFIALPYVNLPILGSFTGVQLAEVLGTPSSSNASNGQITTFNFALLMWAVVALVAVAGAIALWQIAHRYSTGMRISPFVTLLVLSTSSMSLMILVYQYFSLQSSAVGPVVALYLGSGFWGTG